MRKIILTPSEHNKYDVIKAVVNNRKSIRRASVELGLCERSIRRLRLQYLSQGKLAFQHGNHRLHTQLKFNKDVKNKIVNLYLTKYNGFNIKHFSEFLNNEEQLNISYSSVLKILTARHVVSPKTQRKTKRRIRKELETKQYQRLLSKREEATYQAVQDVEAVKAHPSRPRKKYFGELVQMDASQEIWFGAHKSFLHLAIDDRTGQIIGAYFDEQETLKGYYQVLSQILESYGTPVEILTDRRTIFDYKRKAHPNTTSDTLTNFGYACSTLGTKLSTTSIPQAKGRVERVFETLQSRLINEMFLKNIQNIEDANTFLINNFIPKFNQQFGLPIKSTMDVFSGQMKSKDIEMALITMEERTVDRGHCISFENKTWSLNNQDHQVMLPHKTKVEVVKTFLNNYYVTFDDRILRMMEVLPVEPVSKEIDYQPSKPRIVKQIPKLTHPWRRDNRKRFEHNHQLAFAIMNG
ncbi:ISNCY family transposase [Pediococcus argentinicus]|uniref:Transposase n=1 Tax=Pediococcus argentinicus TaxID=480391 RepID=A0A0R2N380_9LACO|nr:ISNCY family transposase [Pediococcus argentinicus]KRO20318.1 transposase [Pediococcus argentinicus]NKZ23190.1 ISNCY family transposase [Pediococcus argentinicus]GEP20403.1 transposase [Pediococcus argentinicus]